MSIYIEQEQYIYFITGKIYHNIWNINWKKVYLFNIFNYICVSFYYCTSHHLYVICLRKSCFWESNVNRNGVEVQLDQHGPVSLPLSSCFFFLILFHLFYHNLNLAYSFSRGRAKAGERVFDFPSYPWCGTLSSTAAFPHPTTLKGRRNIISIAAELRPSPLMIGVSLFSLTLMRPWWTSAAMIPWLPWRLVESCQAGWRTRTAPATIMSTCSVCWPTSLNRESRRQLSEAMWKSSLLARASRL